MCQAEGLKVLLADEKECDVIHCSCRGGVVAAIEDRQLSDGTARAVNAKHLFASVCRTFEDADMSGLNYIQSGTPLAFAEHDLARAVVPRHGTLSQEAQFAFGEP